MKKRINSVLVFFLFISCASISKPGKIDPAPEGVTLQLDNVGINIYGYMPPEGGEIEAAVLYYPSNHNYALSFTYREFVYLQHFNAEIRDMFTHSFESFLNDKERGTLEAKGAKARQFYGKSGGYTEFESPGFYGTFISKPVMEFGYLYHNNGEYFSVTQGEADLEGYPPKGRAVSPKIPVYFRDDEAEKLADLFNLDPSPIVCFGDNVTSGYAAVRRGIVDKSRSYPAYLQEKIKVPVINSGGGWETTVRALRRLDQDVLAYEPQIVLLLFGANDLTEKIPLEETQKNLEEMINRINNGKREIFLIKFYSDMDRLYSIMWDWEQSREERQDFINALEEMYAALSRMDHVKLITDAWTGVWGENMSSDYNNPVAAGNEIMADNIFSALKPLLEERNAVK